MSDLWDLALSWLIVRQLLQAGLAGQLLRQEVNEGMLLLEWWTGLAVYATACAWVLLHPQAIQLQRPQSPGSTSQLPPNLQQPSSTAL